MAIQHYDEGSLEQPPPHYVSNRLDAGRRQAPAFFV